MYSGDDPMSNYTRPYEQSRVDATLLAQVLPTVHQPMSNFPSSDDHACNHLPDQRCTTLDHYSVLSPIMHVDNNANSLKKQKLAMHINTRHMALYHPTSDALSHQHSSPPAQDLANLFISPQVLEPEPEPSIGNEQPNSTPETSHMENIDIFAPMEMSIPSQNVSKKLPIVPFKPIPATHSSHHRINAAASSSQIPVGHVGVRSVAQAEFLKSVQRWTKGIRHIWDIRKQQLDFELFGDNPSFTAEAPDLLKLLRDIDQKKNQVTYEEERATGLIKAISDILETCDRRTEKESIMLAGKILDNFLQRFQAVRFRGGSG